MSSNNNDSDEVLDLCSVSLYDLISPTPTLDNSVADTIDHLLDLPFNPTFAPRNASASASAPTAVSNMAASAPPAAASSPVWFNRTDPEHISALNRNKATAQATYDQRNSLRSPIQQKNQYDPNGASLSISLSKALSKTWK